MEPLKKLASYGLWIVLAVLGVWAFVLGRSVLITVLAVFAGNSFNRTNQANFLYLFFNLILGLAWFAFVIFSEDRIRRGIKKGMVLRNFSRLVGPLLLFLFALDLIIFIYQGFAVADLLRTLIFFLELILGIVFIFLGWSNRSPLFKKHSPPAKMTP